MSALVASNAVLAGLQAALAKADGMPRRGVVVGGPDYLQKTYSPGAAGWTDNVANIFSTTTGKRALEVPPAFEKHLGKTVLVGTTNIVLPALATLVSVTPAPPPFLKPGS